MNNKFAGIIDKMPVYLQRLLDKSPVLINDIGVTQVPQKGIYVLFERNNPVYVGRSNRLKKRLKEHSQNSADQYSATLAFRIAKGILSSLNQVKPGITGSQLMKNNDFVQEFNKAKSRIAKMKIRFIEIEDQIEQTIFEVYTHLELKTKYNDFSTH